MSLPVVLLSGADADLQEIFNRFEDYRDGFGVEFMTAVDAYLARIANFSDRNPQFAAGHGEHSSQIAPLISAGYKFAIGQRAGLNGF